MECPIQYVNDNECENDWNNDVHKIHRGRSVRQAFVTNTESSGVDRQLSKTLLTHVNESIDNEFKLYKTYSILGYNKLHGKC